MLIDIYITINPIIEWKWDVANDIKSKAHRVLISSYLETFAI